MKKYFKLVLFTIFFLTAIDGHTQVVVDSSAMPKAITSSAAKSQQRIDKDIKSVNKAQRKIEKKQRHIDKQQSRINGQENKKDRKMKRINKEQKKMAKDTL